MTPLKAKLLYHLTLTPLLLLYLAFAFPILGFFVFDYFTHDLIDACGRTTEGLPKSPCLMNGVDIADVSGSYIGSMFLLGILNPLIAFKAIPAIVPVYYLAAWALLILFFRYRSRKTDVESNA